VFAEWEDEASLAYHFAETYKQMGEYFGEVPGEIIRDVSVRKYLCSQSGAVHDEQGQPRLDFLMWNKDCVSSDTEGRPAEV